jgi:hypothetical protein
MTVRPPSGGIDAVAGALTHHGGTITTLKPGANCTNQQYPVTARLQDVLSSARRVTRPMIQPKSKLNSCPRCSSSSLLNVEFAICLG